MAKHTPGPWQVGKYHHVCASDELAEKMGSHSDDGFQLAEVYTPPIPAFLTGADCLPGYNHRDAMDEVDAQCKANTRLMAAAPTMLEALKRVALVVGVGDAAVCAAISEAEGDDDVEHE